MYANASNNRLLTPKLVRTWWYKESTPPLGPYLTLIPGKFISMLVWFRGKCMVSIININNSTKKNLPMDLKIIPPIKYWYLVHMSRWENLYVPKLLWVNNILNYDELGQYLPRYDGSCLVYRPKSHREQNYHQTPIP